MSKTYVPLHLHSHGSLLDAISRPHEITERCLEIGATACALSDHGVVSELIPTYKAFKKHDIKLLYGCELYLCEQDPTIQSNDNRSLSHLVVWCKNLNGWKNLLKIIEKSNSPENYYYKPRLNLTKLAKYSKDIMCMSGHIGSDASSALFVNPRLAYKCRTIEDAGSILKPDWLQAAKEKVGQYLDIFGRDNFFIEIQLIDKDNLPVAQVIADCLRQVAKEMNVLCASSSDSHYCYKHQAQDHRVLITSNLRTTLSEVKSKMDASEEVGLEAFYRSNNYHIPTYDEFIQVGNTEEELDNTNYIASLCENFSILKKPDLPKFQCPNGQDSHEYFKELCREGWRKKVAGKVDKSKYPEYVQRLEHELGVLKEANITDYMLIAWDVLQAARNRGEFVGRGRGSVGGCLCAYLVDIVGVCPLEYGLIFERFYNAGRNTKEHTQLPDTDLEFQQDKRHLTIEYIENKYGKNKVAHIATYSRLMGRSALKEVLRVNDAVSFEEMNRITKCLPDESKISDQLEEMREEDDDVSIIKWALINNSKELEEWCVLKDDGKLEGPLSKYFSQAARVEGVKKSQGVHASGIVICSNPISDVAPLILDKNSGKPIVGLDHRDAESVSLVKLDVLGLTVLSKLKRTIEIVATPV